MGFSNIHQSSSSSSLHSAGVYPESSIRSCARLNLQEQVSVLLSGIEPQYQNAAKALYRSPMRQVDLSASVFFEKIKSTPGLSSQGGITNPLPRLLKHKAYHQATHNTHALFFISQRVAFHVNQAQVASLSTLKIKQMIIAEVLSHPDNKLQEDAVQNFDKLNRSLDTALSMAKVKVEKQIKIRSQSLQERVNERVTQLQHRAFLHSIPWHKVSSELQMHVMSEFAINDAFGSHHPDRLVKAVALAFKQLEPGYSLDMEGARFESFKRTPQARLDATQILSANGHVYALINTPTASQARMIESQYKDVSISANEKKVLGQGGFGTVRFAQNLATGEIVAVKKFDSWEEAKKEIEQYAAVGKGKRFQQLIDFAHVHKLNEVGQWREKSYLFITFANGGDGLRAMEHYQQLRKTDAREAQDYFLKIAKEYSGAVSDLHDRCVFHRDIKPENFLHYYKDAHNHKTGEHRFDERMVISDFNLSSFKLYTEEVAANQYEKVGGTKGYFPPEGRGGPLYRSDRHDAYSLGITLLEFKLGAHPKNIPHPHLKLEDGTYLKFSFNDRSNLKGFTLQGPSKNNSAFALSKLPLTSDAHIIARLIDPNPRTRLSVMEAHEAFLALDNQK